MDLSVFLDKTLIPNDELLKDSLGATFEYWTLIREYVNQVYSGGINEWNYPGAKYGWSFRIKDKKRAIIYLLPRDSFFKVAFVFGQKAFDYILNEDLPEFIKNELNQAKVYAEGRGIRIDVKNEDIIPTIKELIDIKLKF